MVEPNKEPERKSPDGRDIRPRGLAVPRAHAEITLNTERELLAMARPLAKRLAADPEFSVMLLSNPILALEKYGIRLTPRLQKHLFLALRHPKAMRERRAALERSLEKALDEAPRPNDPVWLARLVFKTRELAARDTTGLLPAYREEDPGGIIAALRESRRPATHRYSQERRMRVVSRLGVAASRPTVRRLDLDAPVPALNPARKAPATLPLEQAWFYKDDAIVRDLVELGQIERRAFPFRTPGEFRRIQKGEQVDGFRAFIRALRIDPRKRV